MLEGRKQASAGDGQPDRRDAGAQGQPQPLRPRRGHRGPAGHEVVARHEAQQPVYSH